jgi:hypothetical protein
VRAEIPVETIIREVTERVTQRVIRELADQGIQIVSAAGSDDARKTEAAACSGNGTVRSERADMTGYRTPVLTERHVRRLHEFTGAVIVPLGTVVSPKAKELLKDKNIQLCIE